MWFSSLFSILFWLGNVVLVVLLSSCFSHFPPRGCHLRVRVVFAVELMHHILTFFGCAAKKKRRHDLCVHIYIKHIYIYNYIYIYNRYTSNLIGYLGVKPGDLPQFLQVKCKFSG